MSKKGKDFKMPSPLFGKVFYETLAGVAVNEYRKITFDKSNPKMSDCKQFKKYTSKTYESRKKANKLRRQDGSYSNSTAPVLSGDLMLDTKASASPKENAIYIGWSSHAYKVDHLRKMGRILTSKSNPINPNVIKKLMPSFNKELKRTMPKGTQTITIGKK